MPFSSLFVKGSSVCVWSTLPHDVKGFSSSSPLHNSHTSFSHSGSLSETSKKKTRKTLLTMLRRKRKRKTRMRRLQIPQRTWRSSWWRWWGCPGWGPCCSPSSPQLALLAWSWLPGLGPWPQGQLNFYPLKAWLLVLPSSLLRCEDYGSPWPQPPHTSIY